MTALRTIYEFSVETASVSSAFRDFVNASTPGEASAATAGIVASFRERLNKSWMMRVGFQSRPESRRRSA
jgi:hypothetical protein